MSDKHHSPEYSLVNSLKSPNLKTMKPNPSLDDFMTDGYGADIPFFGTMYKGVKTVTSATNFVLTLRDALLARKVYDFLFEHRDISLEQRVRFLRQFETDEDLAEFGNNILLRLDSYTHLQKALVLGKLSRMLHLELIDRPTFHVLAHALEVIIVDDLNLLLEIKQKEEIKSTPDQIRQLKLERLMNAGLLKALDSLQLLEFGGVDKELSQYGLIMQKILKDESPLADN